MRRDLFIPALIGLGVYAQTSEIALNNNTTILLILYLLLQDHQELEELKNGAKCDHYDRRDNIQNLWWNHNPWWNHSCHCWCNDNFGPETRRHNETRCCNESRRSQNCEYGCDDYDRPIRRHESSHCDCF